VPNIIVRDLHFSHTDSSRAVFRGISFTLSTVWRCALVGRNGRGKTTLLRLLNQQLIPQAAEFEVPLPTLLFPGLYPGQPSAGEPQSGISSHEAARAIAGPYREIEQAIDRLSQRTDPNRPSTIEALNHQIENFEALEGYTIDSAIDRELDALGIDGKRRYEQLSGGEQTRVMLAGLFARKDIYRLVDEPTNHLDRAGRRLVSDYLAQQSGYLLVSHDRHFVDECCDHVLGLRAQDTHLIKGSYSDYHTEADRDNAREQRTNAGLKKELRRLEQAAVARRDGAHAREREKGAHADNGYIGHKAAKQMRRALNIEQRADAALAEKRALLQNLDKTRQLKLNQAARKSGTPLCQVNNLSIGYNGSTIAANLELELKVGDRLAITGANGCGKTCLLRTLLGEVPAMGGTVRWAPGTRKQQARQQPGGPFPAPTNWSLFLQILGVLGVDGDLINRRRKRLFAPTPSTDSTSEPTTETADSVLSQGQLKKIELAYSFVEPVDVLIWDEPLNYMDIQTREQLLELVLSAQPTVVFVEHDAYFVSKTATQELALSST